MCRQRTLGCIVLYVLGFVVVLVIVLHHGQPISKQLGTMAPAHDGLPAKPDRCDDG